MANHKPGLGNFDIGAAFGDPDKPADLEHYVTAKSPPVLKSNHKSTPKPKRKPRAASQAAPRTRPTLAEMATAAQSAPPAVEAHLDEQPASAEPRQGRGRPRRRDIGSSVEVDELIDHQILPALRETGPQRDATASEFFQAAAFLIAPICQFAQYSRLRPRGPWGSPQARDFIRTLSELYSEALGERYVKTHYRQIRARIEADIEREADRAQNSA